jgi:hypothetical protein
MIKAMEREFGIKQLQGRLGGGTPFVSFLEYVIEFDLTNPNLAGVLEY